ncbi:MAG: hypothetical protein QOF70_5941 [Acetobacteraceae bacterium]|nr:hypothetical protein [Acetobacteraceae bacterium]
MPRFPVSRSGLAPVSWPNPTPVPRSSPTLVSWPGLARPPTTLHQPHQQIVPLEIPGYDQTDLPRSWPTLQARFALNGGPHVAVSLAIHQAIQLVPAGKRRSSTLLVRPDATGQGTRYAQIPRSVRSIGHDVYPAGGHRRNDAPRWLRKSVGNAVRTHFDDSRTGEVVGGRARLGHDTGHDAMRTP